MIKIKVRNNRAMFGDQVAIELDNPAQWIQGNSSSLPTEAEKEEYADTDNNLTADIQSESRSVLQVIEHQPSLLPTGRIVAVVKT